MTTKDAILANARLVVRECMSGADPLPLVSAAAVAGNGWQENLMRPITTGPKDHGSDGLLQWRLDRLDELQRRKDWDTLPVQVQYFKDECKRDYPGLWRMLVNPGNRSLENLTLNICDIYERPSAAGRKPDLRIKYARQVYALFDTQPAPADPIKIPPVLKPATDGWTSAPGLAALVIAFMIFSGKHLPGLVGSTWLPWAIIGGMCIFFLDSRKTKPTTEGQDMNPSVLLILEKLLPAVIQVLHDIPKIRADIETLKTGGVVTKEPDDVLDRLRALLDKIGNLNDEVK
jgi:hypothetical protein